MRPWINELDAAAVNLFRPDFVIEAIDPLLIEHCAVLVVGHRAQTIPDEKRSDC